MKLERKAHVTWAVPFNPSSQFTWESDTHETEITRAVSSPSNVEAFNSNWQSTLIPFNCFFLTKKLFCLTQMAPSEPSHSPGAGSIRPEGTCNRCGDQCPGYTAHFWRSVKNLIKLIKKNSSHVTAGTANQLHGAGHVTSAPPIRWLFCWTEARSEEGFMSISILRRLNWFKLMSFCRPFTWLAGYSRDLWGRIPLARKCDFNSSHRY